MAKIKIGGIINPSIKKPEVVKDIKTFFANTHEEIYDSQITDIPLGFDVTIPEGFIGILSPMPSMVAKSSVLVENGGIVIGTFNKISMRKGTGGGVKIRKGEPLFTLVLVPMESFDITYY